MICSTCEDTHRMWMENLGREVPCTRCPRPCRSCACNGGAGAYCAVLPCLCVCHPVNASPQPAAAPSPRPAPTRVPGPGMRRGGEPAPKHVPMPRPPIEGPEDRHAATVLRVFAVVVAVAAVLLLVWMLKLVLAAPNERARVEQLERDVHELRQRLPAEAGGSR
jgi:hypothetical protein